MVSGWDLEGALERNFGHPGFREGQLRVIETLLEGKTTKMAREALYFHFPTTITSTPWGPPEPSAPGITN